MVLILLTKSRMGPQNGVDVMVFDEPKIQIFFHVIFPVLRPCLDGERLSVT